MILDIANSYIQECRLLAQLTYDLVVTDFNFKLPLRNFVELALCGYAQLLVGRIMKDLIRTTPI